MKLINYYLLLLLIFKSYFIDNLYIYIIIFSYRNDNSQQETAYTGMELNDNKKIARWRSKLLRGGLFKSAQDKREMLKNYP